MLFSSMFAPCASREAYDTTFTRYETLLIMPRTAGVSSSSRTELIPRSPSPRTVARWLSRVPIRPLTSCTLIVFAMSFTLAQDFFNGLAALGCNLRWGVHFRQAIQRSADQVVRVGRTVGLRHHVRYAHHFKNRAHRAAGDHAGTVFCRAHHHRRSAMLAGHA